MHAHPQHHLPPLPHTHVFPRSWCGCAALQPTIGIPTTTPTQTSPPLHPNNNPHTNITTFASQQQPSHRLCIPTTTPTPTSRVARQPPTPTSWAARQPPHQNRGPHDSPAVLRYCGTCRRGAGQRLDGLPVVRSAGDVPAQEGQVQGLLGHHVQYEPRLGLVDGRTAAEAGGGVVPVRAAVAVGREARTRDGKHRVWMTMRRKRVHLGVP